MLKKIQQFLASLNEASENAQPAHSLETSCAVLLCEVMKADGLMADEEQQHMATVLMREFTLTPIEVDDVIEQAIYLSENATDFYQFTSTLNQHYSTEQRVKMIELLWQLAYSDGELSSIEEHIIRKIADLLHLRQSEFIQTKLTSAPPVQE
ncbi:TerB family tellurite resistance protein [Thalassotalea atypica]|uniref:tellurite resistance TerB family protein n=1 Tax=Thalassotalea atypica TaxID=2054316 RepID=UPI002574775F|nr:TerB family tellurite resistance protein [Thalassotalea atypica]